MAGPLCTLRATHRPLLSHYHQRLQFARYLNCLLACKELAPIGPSINIDHRLTISEMARACVRSVAERYRDEVNN